MCIRDRHWPVFVIAEERSATPLSNVARVVCVLITLALSVASYYAIEHPLRSSPLLRARNPRTEWDRARKALALGAAAIVVALAVSVYTNNRAASAIKQASSGAATTGRSAVPSTLTAAAGASANAQIAAMQNQVGALVRQGLTLDRIPPDVNPPALELALDPTFSRCLQPRSATTVKPCTFGTPTGHRTLIVFGDSHAMQWMPALDVLGKRVATG